MTLAKKAQFLFPVDSIPHTHPEEGENEEIVLELDEPGEEKSELVFTLPPIPGAEDDSDIIVDEPSDIEVAEEDVEVEEQDPWNWHSGGFGNFLNWLHNMIQNVPRHSGRDTTGLEKAIAYFEALDKEITKAMRNDYRNEIDSAKAEEARAQIEDGLDRLVERLEKVRTTKYKRHNKKNKKADLDTDGLIKEAQKAERIGGIVVTVPLLISSIARTMINGTISAGHDMQGMFDKLSKKFDLTVREQAELMQLLSDMGYPIRRDRGLLLDEEFDGTSSDNFDLAANFNS